MVLLTSVWVPAEKAQLEHPNNICPCIGTSAMQSCRHLKAECLITDCVGFFVPEKLETIQVTCKAGSLQKTTGAGQRLHGMYP